MYVCMYMCIRICIYAWIWASILVPKWCYQRLCGSILVRFGGHFWSIFGQFWNHFGSFGRVSRDTYKKLSKKLKRTPPKLHLEASWSSSWSYLERRWRPRAPRWANMTAKMAILGSTWRLLGRFGEHFGAIWANKLNIEKHWKTLGFYWFFEDLGSPGEQFWSILALCWAMLAHLGAILEQLGEKMEAKNDKMSEDGGQERQHEPTQTKKSRKRAQHKPVLANEREARKKWESM